MYSLYLQQKKEADEAKLQVSDAAAGIRDCRARPSVLAIHPRSHRIYFG